MDENLMTAIVIVAIAAAWCSAYAVGAWSDARRREREAYYRAETIKKVAEMEGATPEPVLDLLREALKPPPEPNNTLRDLLTLTPRLRNAFHKREMLTRLAEASKGGPEAALALMREEERNRARHIRDGLKLAGVITAAAGVGIFIFLQQLIPDRPVYLAGLIPLLVGAAFLAYAIVFAPGE